jgi:antitoxin (DNA-binding transcriptional repressor) of toxin-antitoxin stability system
MTALTEDEVRANLPQLIDRLGPGEELVITRGDRPVARLVPDPTARTGVPVYGRGRGKVVVDLDDDGHLNDFAEYMP